MTIHRDFPARPVLRRLRRLLDGGIEIRDGGLRRRGPGLELWLDYAWTGDGGCPALSPRADAPRNRVRIPVTTRRDPRALLLAAACAVAEMAAGTGLGLRVLDAGNGVSRRERRRA